MTNNLAVGQTIEGKVTGIQSYGAFVALDENIQGLVHISEVTHGFVQDINDHLSIGDQVNVKILNIDEEKGKYSLSIRATMEKPEKNNKPRKQAVKQPESDGTTGFNTMKDKLEQWLQQSEQR